MITRATPATKVGDKPPRMVAKRAVRISPPSRAEGKKSFTEPPTHRIQIAVRNRGRLALGTSTNQAAPSLNRRPELIAATTGNAQLALARAARIFAAPSRTHRAVNSNAPATANKYPISRIFDPGFMRQFA